MKTLKIRKVHVKDKDGNYITLDSVGGDQRKEVEQLQSDVRELGEKDTQLETAIEDKVAKVPGKGLSTNDYSDAAKAKVDAIPSDPKYTDTVYDDAEIKRQIQGKYTKPSTGIPAGDIAAGVIPEAYDDTKIMEDLVAIKDDLSHKLDINNPQTLTLEQQTALQDVLGILSVEEVLF